MQSEALFDDFLAGVVNLNATRITLLEDSIEAIKEAIHATSWLPRIEGWAPQGSWAHETIIRPQKDKAFDADLLVFVRPVSGWDAKEYINSLHGQLRLNGRYRDRLHRYSHCVTIDYAGERKIDIAPVIIGRNGGNGLDVCNRTTNSFERTEPLAYTEWLASCNSITLANGLTKTTRLIKYLRDIKQTSTCPSVLLTTLIGQSILPSDRGQADVVSVPNTLLTVFRRLDDRLSDCDQRISVTNPALPDEEFGLLWKDDDQFCNFRDKVSLYRGWIEDAYFEEDPDENLTKWQRVFGEEFARGGSLKEARQVGERAKQHLSDLGFEIGDPGIDLVGLVSQFGDHAFPPGFVTPSYLEAPRRQFESSSIGCKIVATEHNEKDGDPLVRLESLTPIKKEKWVRFSVTGITGLPFSTKDYSVLWRVTNTDEAAALENELRGDFVRSSTGHLRWEHTAFRGVHFVEAFVIRKRNNCIVSQSPPFFVVVE